MTCHDALRLLDSYVDGELPPDEEAEFRAHADMCSACRAQLDARLALRREIRRIPYRAAPDHLRVAVASAPRPRTFRPLLAWAAVFVAGIALGAAAVTGYGARARIAPPISLTEAVVDGHVRALMGDHLLDVVSTDQHTVKPWFLGKLDFAPPVTDLAAQGFPLVGGRLDYIGGRSVAALVYRRGGHTINVFIWPDTSGGDGADAIRGFNVQHWTQQGMSFRAVSDLNATELAAFAKALQES